MLGLVAGHYVRWDPAAVTDRYPGILGPAAYRGAVLAIVFRQSLKPVMWGIPLGLAGSAMISVLLGKLVVTVENPDLLFGANPWSPATFAAVLLFLIAIVLMASWIPARRAMRIDPATALRYE